MNTTDTTSRGVATPLSENTTPRGGPAVLDIGGDIGALVVIVPDELAGTEIEISPIDAAQSRTHTGVHPREFRTGSRLVALFPALHCGDYQLWHPHDDTLLATAHVVGDHVTQLDLSHVVAERAHTGDPEHHVHTHH
ncbi:hypothetical protein [Antrihabitans cavernicola]|uniref:Phospholipase n=1 Tax=Antrihabitans cavernicola TaxID=2495913 RepID=A0A5A7S0V9_9NOCA|nr:hypothetical protein [Spelaeibacter cavernicola]KAA0016557.1 hypothetical protein FOY51_26050 [Spelaeibacter cavernicola]